MRQNARWWQHEYPRLYTGASTAAHTQLNAANKTSTCEISSCIETDLNMFNINITVECDAMWQYWWRCDGCCPAWHMTPHITSRHTAAMVIGHLVSCCNLVFIAPILHLMVVCGCRSHWRFSPLCVHMLSFVCLLFIKLNQLEKLECAGKYFDNYKYSINL